MLEIERKFLAANDDWKTHIHKSYEIKQGYMCADKTRTVRIRLRDQQAFITIKGKSKDGGLSRYEWEKEINLEDGIALFELCEPRRIEKVRHEVYFSGKKFEIDEFRAENSGLTLIELELNDKNEEFVRPDWLGQEVTGDFRYYNSFLTNHPYTNWT